MPERPRVLGIEALDAELGPCLPPGWMGLLVGRSGSSTNLFAKQFAQAGLGLTPVFYFTTVERSSDIEATFRAFGWDPSGLTIGNLADEYYTRVLSHSLEASRLRERGLRYAEIAAGSERTGLQPTYDVASRLISELAGIDAPFRLVLDSVDFLLEILDPAGVMTVARQIRHRAQALGGQALLVVQGDIHERRTTGVLEDIADLVVEISDEPADGTYRHQLAIRKVRNHPEQTRLVTAVGTSKGLALSNNGAGRAP